MIDYSQHPYKRLLEFIDTGCQKIHEERDFVTHLLSMKQADSIEELVRILNVTFKVLAVIHFGNRTVPSYWYKYLSWGIDDNYYVNDLFSFFNENLLRWCKAQKRNRELNKLCIANLRDGRNQYPIAEIIIGLKHEMFDAEIIAIERERDNFFYLRREINKYCTNKTTFNGAVNNLGKSAGIIAANGRLFDITEEETTKEYNLDIEKLRLEYKTELEVRLKQEEERRKQEIKRESIENSIVTNKFIDSVGSGIGLIVGNLFLGFIGALFSGLRKGKF